MKSVTRIFQINFTIPADHSSSQPQSARAVMVVASTISEAASWAEGACKANERVGIGEITHPVVVLDGQPSLI